MRATSKFSLADRWGVEAWKNVRLRNSLLRRCESQSAQMPQEVWTEAHSQQLWKRLEGRMPDTKEQAAKGSVALTFYLRPVLAMGALALVLSTVAMMKLFSSAEQSGFRLKSAQQHPVVSFPRLFGARLDEQAKLERLENFGVLQQGQSLVFGYAGGPMDELKVQLNVRSPDGSSKVLVDAVSVVGKKGYLRADDGYFSVKLDQIGVYTFHLSASDGQPIQFVGDALDAQFQVRVHP